MCRRVHLTPAWTSVDVEGQAGRLSDVCNEGPAESPCPPMLEGSQCAPSPPGSTHQLTDDCIGWRLPKQEGGGTVPGDDACMVWGRWAGGCPESVRPCRGRHEEKLAPSGQSHTSPSRGWRSQQMWGGLVSPPPWKEAQLSGRWFCHRACTTRLPCRPW